MNQPKSEQSRNRDWRMVVYLIVHLLAHAGSEPRPNGNLHCEVNVKPAVIIEKRQGDSCIEGQLGALNNHAPGLSAEAKRWNDGVGALRNEGTRGATLPAYSAW